MANIVSKDAWLQARIELLKKEKEHTKARDELARAKQSMPWVKVEKDYLFDGPDGKVTLKELFEGKNQLIVYHFMYDPEWDVGCKSCSLIAEHYGPSIVHLAQRDVAMATVSRAPLEKLEEFRKRMKWNFKWVSSANSDFNMDFCVTLNDEKLTQENNYNFNTTTHQEKEAPGMSVFTMDNDGQIYHTYSTYARGLEDFLTVYRLLDIVPKGRDEDNPSYGMDWVRLKDNYVDDSLINLNSTKQ